MDNIVLNRRKISGNSSVILDSLRLLSAFVVLISHAVYQWLVGYPKIIELMNNLAHAAVTVFFVLSGYLIAYTTTSNNRGPRQYAVARLSRLYSMVLPAVLITIICQLLIHQLNPTLESEYQRGNVVFRYVLALFFCNEIGTISASPPLNNPLWSLSFEFWYYVIFGFWFFRNSNWKSWIMIILSCLIAGPKILLLMPIWLFGLLAYRIPDIAAFRKYAWFLVVLFICLAIAAKLYLPQFPLILGRAPFYYANEFLTDWIASALFALGIWVMPIESKSIISSKSVKRLRSIADLSFPLYILHYPFLVLWRAVLGTHVNNITEMCIAIVGVTVISIVVGLFLEHQRLVWVDLFNRIAQLIKSKLLFAK